MPERYDAIVFIFLFLYVLQYCVCSAVDYEFLVVSRRTFLEMASHAGAVDEKFWPGYKEAYYKLSEEKRISTLKVFSS